MHRSHLANTSPFFQAALQKEWKEGREGAILLPEDDADAMNAFLHYAYMAEIPCKRKYSDDSTDEAYHDPEWLLLAKLYVLGEKYQHTRLKDVVASSIISKSRVRDHAGGMSFPSPSAIDIIYKGTTPASRIRRLILDFHATDGGMDWLDGAEHNAEFVLDLARDLFRSLDWMRDMGSMETPLIHTCDYHEHDIGDRHSTCDRSRDSESRDDDSQNGSDPADRG